MHNFLEMTERNKNLCLWICTQMQTTKRFIILQFLYIIAIIHNEHEHSYYYNCFIVYILPDSLNTAVEVRQVTFDKHHVNVLLLQMLLSCQHEALFDETAVEKTEVSILQHPQESRCLLTAVLTNELSDLILLLKFHLVMLYAASMQLDEKGCALS